MGTRDRERRLIRAIIVVLGGRDSVAMRLGMKSGNTVQKWEEAGVIPARHYLSIKEMCKKFGYIEPSTDLFSFEEPPT